MTDYLVLLHEDPAATSKLSPTQMQALIQRYSQWVNELREQGRLSAAMKLKDEGGRHMRGEPGRMLASDGPYAEGKDIITGFFLVNASSYDDAQSLLASGPHLEFGWIELREIDVVG